MSGRAPRRPIPCRTVVVASSAGGLNALLVILPALPATFPSPIICVQHMSPTKPSFLAQILERRCAMGVAVAARGQQPRAGVVLIAPPDHHVVLQADGHIDLWDGPPVNHVRPSADLLFSSAAEVLGDRTVALVLSGTGHDGAAGAAAVRQRDGTVLVQSPGTCAFPGMVESTMRVVEPDAVLPLAEIAPALQQLADEAAA